MCYSLSLTVTLIFWTTLIQVHRVHRFNIYCSAFAGRYLGGKLLVLLRQDPGPGVEVVLFGEELLHRPDGSTHVDLPQHFNHPCGASSILMNRKMTFHSEDSSSGTSSEGVQLHPKIISQNKKRILHKTLFVRFLLEVKYITQENCSQWKY